MTFRDMVAATNPAFIFAFGEPVAFVYGPETIEISAIVNIVNRVPWLTDNEDQTDLKSIDCNPPDVSWLTDELAQYWQVRARGVTYTIAGTPERNEMTTIYLADILPEDN